MACSLAMTIANLLFHLVSVLFGLAQDAFRFLLLGTRSSAALKAENLFLRKQLALYVERKAHPRRATDATRLALSSFQTAIPPMSKKAKPPIANIAACRQKLALLVAVGSAGVGAVRPSCISMRASPAACRRIALSFCRHRRSRLRIWAGVADGNTCQ